MAKNTNDLNIAIGPNVGAGTYSNLAVISHSATEFCLDFAQMVPGNPNGNAVVHQRIIMAPQHVKRLLAALGDNVQKYENVFGTIQMPEFSLEPGNPEGRGGSVPFDINPQGKA